MFRKTEALLILCLIFIPFLLSVRGSAVTSAKESDSSPITVVIDAGHGGNDPGKIGIDNSMEKDVNLVLAKKLQRLLENKGLRVILTRTSDDNLAPENASSKKREDMKRRAEIIRDADAACCISIHLNSYPASSVRGAQVFFHSESSKSRMLAQNVQNRLNEILLPEKPRKEKANSDYYLLRKTPTPTIIAECGFLSNPIEAALLHDNTYQDRVARALYFGICDYIFS